MSVLSDPKPSPLKGSQRRRMALVALPALMSLVLLGCPPSSPVGSLGFHGSVDDQIYATGWPITPIELPQNRPAQEGPYLHTLESFNARRQPAHSNMIATLGRNSGQVRLRVTAVGENRITVVVKE